ncbi:MAG: ATP-binding protein [Armatimonadota bacterium]|nr:ATP-binding protein [Armatimonadota bacterium]
MRPSLLWKLLAINLLVVGVATAVAAVHIGGVADGIFMRLMKEFNIETQAVHALFVRDLRSALLGASLIAAAIGLLLSLVLFRTVVRPVRGMMTMAGRIAAGDYGVRAPVTSSDELGRLAASLNLMASALARLERQRKDLVADVAHELRTPLSNLRGYLEAVRDGVTPASPETVSLLHDEVMRLVRLVQALHELSLFDARLPDVRAEAVDPGAVVRRVLDLRRGEFASRGVAVREEIRTGVAVAADADLLTQALHNLLDNAARHTPDGGAVTVRTVAETGAVRIAVTNTGEGIDAADLPHIFERFYRGDKSRARASGGAGIGLAIVKEVARIHGGDVGASSAGGETTVWFSIAARPSAAPTTPRLEEPVPAPTARPAP